MKKILEIALFLIAFGCHAQNVTIEGRYTFYQSDDSTASFSLPHSTTIYDSDSKLIYEQFFLDLDDSTSEIFFKDYRNSPETFIQGFISKKDTTTKYTHTYNCTAGKGYTIKNDDTTHRQAIECVNNELVRVASIDSLESYDTLIRTNNTSYWKSSPPYDGIKYSYEEFDSNDRVILSLNEFSGFLNSEGNFTRHEYDDENHIETITSSAVGVEDQFATIVINYCDDDWILVKKRGHRNLRRR